MTQHASTMMTAHSERMNTMEKLITRMGFAMIIIGLMGLSQTAFAQGSDQEYNDLFDDVSNYIPIYEDDLGRSLTGSMYEHNEHDNVYSPYREWGIIYYLYVSMSVCLSHEYPMPILCRAMYELCSTMPIL